MIKKIFILFFCIIYSVLSVFAAHIENMLNQTDFIWGGQFSYDLKSFKNDNGVYLIDILEELDPGGDMEDIKCPYGAGNIYHLIYSTVYSPQQKKFYAKYKGFACSEIVYEYENGEPMSMDYRKTGIYYDNNVSLFGKYQNLINTDSLSYISDDIKNNKTDDYVDFINGLLKKN